MKPCNYFFFIQKWFEDIKYHLCLLLIIKYYLISIFIITIFFLFFSFFFYNTRIFFVRVLWTIVYEYCCRQVQMIPDSKFIYPCWPAWNNKKKFKLAFSVLFQENLLTVPIEIVILKNGNISLPSTNTFNTCIISPENALQVLYNIQYVFVRSIPNTWKL